MLIYVKLQIMYKIYFKNMFIVRKCKNYKI